MELKLPAYDPKIQDGTIFCLTRKKWVSLTPEEWVRQHFLNLLISHKKYPKGMIKLEHTMQYFKNLKRSDIMILSEDGSVFLLVECKSYKVNLSQSVVNQLSQYNKIQPATYLAVSNGMKHYVWKKSGSGYESISDLPEYV